MDDRGSIRQKDDGTGREIARFVPSFVVRLEEDVAKKEEIKHTRHLVYSDWRGEGGLAQSTSSRSSSCSALFALTSVVLVAGQS